MALNAERAAEEQRGLIRWLRPDFQNPAAGRATQTQLAIEESEDDEAEAESKADVSSKKGKRSFRTPVPKQSLGTSAKVRLPEKLPEQVLAIRQQLTAASVPLTAAEMAQRFTRGNADRIEELLQSLVTLGIAREVEGGKYVSA